MKRITELAIEALVRRLTDINAEIQELRDADPPLPEETGAALMEPAVAAVRRRSRPRRRKKARTYTPEQREAVRLRMTRYWAKKKRAAR